MSKNAVFLGNFHDNKTCKNMQALLSGFVLKRGKGPRPHTFSFTKKTARLVRADIVLTKDPNGLTKDDFVVEKTGRGLVVKRPGVLSKDDIGP